MDTDRAPQLYKDLCAARDSLCVANYLHLLYLVTPYDLVEQARPIWMVYLDQVRFLTLVAAQSICLGLHDNYDKLQIVAVLCHWAQQL